MKLENGIFFCCEYELCSNNTSLTPTSYAIFVFKITSSYNELKSFCTTSFLHQMLSKIFCKLLLHWHFAKLIVKYRCTEVLFTMSLLKLNFLNSIVYIENHCYYNWFLIFLINRIVFVLSIRLIFAQLITLK